MLPTTIILGPATIPVSYLPLEELYGSSTEHPKGIEVSTEVDVRTQAQTLLHEVLHHVSWMYGLEWGERKVRLLEVILVDLVQENPGLFRELLTRAKRPGIEQHDERLSVLRGGDTE